MKFNERPENTASLQQTRSTQSQHLVPKTDILLRHCGLVDSNLDKDIEVKKYSVFMDYWRLWPPVARHLRH